jgi:hypothetical protein
VVARLGTEPARGVGASAGVLVLGFDRARGPIEPRPLLRLGGSARRCERAVARSRLSVLARRREGTVAFRVSGVATVVDVAAVGSAGGDAVPAGAGVCSPAAGGSTGAGVAGSSGAGVAVGVGGAAVAAGVGVAVAVAVAVALGVAVAVAVAAGSCA